MIEMLQHVAAVAALNNCGAALFSQQDYDGAANHFTQALRNSKVLVQPTSNENEDTSESSMTSHVGIDDWMTDVSAEYASDSRASFVYNDAIVIPALETEEYEVVLDWINLSCIAIIFNLSLSYQAIATKTGKKDFAVKALKLFEHAVVLQSNHMREDSSPRCSLFLLAALNNVGYLHRFLGHPKQSDEFFHRILSILMYTVVSGGDVSPYEIFFKNVTRLIHPTCAECAGSA